MRIDPFDPIAYHVFEEVTREDDDDDDEFVYDDDDEFVTMTMTSLTIFSVISTMMMTMSGELKKQFVLMQRKAEKQKSTGSHCSAVTSRKAGGPVGDRTL